VTRKETWASQRAAGGGGDARGEEEGEGKGKITPFSIELTESFQKGGFATISSAREEKPTLEKKVLRGKDSPTPTIREGNGAITEGAWAPAPLKKKKTFSKKEGG